MNKLTENPSKSSAPAGRLIDPPTEEENKAALDGFFAAERIIRAERREAALASVPALERLCEAMRQKTGQSYKLRSLLYSLWNGQAAPLIEVVNLDWSLRKDLCAVILAFGFDSATNPDESFFYRAIEAEIREAGLLAWFLEEFKESEVSK